MLQKVLQPDTLNPSINKGGIVPTRGVPSLTIAQGVGGGALIGGVGGTGVALLLQSIKSTAENIGNPILFTLGVVLSGIAVGAASGAVIAKTTEYSLSIGKDGVSVAAGTQNKPEN